MLGVLAGDHPVAVQIEEAGIPPGFPVDHETLLGHVLGVPQRAVGAKAEVGVLGKSNASNRAGLGEGKGGELAVRVQFEGVLNAVSRDGQGFLGAAAGEGAVGVPAEPAALGKAEAERGDRAGDGRAGQLASFVEAHLFPSAAGDLADLLGASQLAAFEQAVLAQRQGIGGAGDLDPGRGFPALGAGGVRLVGAPVGVKEGIRIRWYFHTMEGHPARHGAGAHLASGVRPDALFGLAPDRTEGLVVIGLLVAEGVILAALAGQGFRRPIRQIGRAWGLRGWLGRGLRGRG